ncbi:MAG: DNA-binding protein [Ruminiclostridium sp.]|nr:DNA-binding protein [Ruminiclostridium sp.]MBQ9934149.1 DNA-binding protein [Ruminiclostridium sp.]
MKNQAYRMAMLYDFYGDLLTARQKEFYDLYYNDDLSLAEIAENYEITRQGVRDIIVRAEKTLEDIEEKTGLIQRFHQTRATVSTLRELTSQIEAINRDRLKDGELEKLCTQLSEAMEDLERE